MTLLVSAVREYRAVSAAALTTQIVRAQQQIFPISQASKSTRLRNQLGTVRADQGQGHESDDVARCWLRLRLN